MEASKEELKQGYTDKLFEAAKLLDEKHYPSAMITSTIIIDSILREMYKDLISDPKAANKILDNVSASEEKKKKDSENSKDNRKIPEIASATFGQLIGIFREAKIFKVWEEIKGELPGIIGKMNFAEIVNRRNAEVHPDNYAVLDGSGSNYAEALLLYSYALNMLVALDYVDLTGIMPLNFRDDPQELASLVLQKERGYIINEADKTRNISFRVDTINQMFDTFLTEMEKELDIDRANDILFKMGYDGGKKFGQEMSKRWDNDNLSREEKIKKWCEFDSRVGWGSFESTIKVDKDIEGELIISANFMNYARDYDQQKICAYIKGYCSGVLGALLRTSVCVNCDGCRCPQDNYDEEIGRCIFKIEKGKRA